jgi:trehalose-6-phosphatase
MSHPDEIELRFMELWRPIAEEHRLSVMRFNRGVELHALGRSKGVALADLYRQMPPDTLPVYIGDDTTDEDAFHYVKSHGLGIKVGLAGATEATGRVPDEAAVLAILRDWLHVTAAPE